MTHSKNTNVVINDDCFKWLQKYDGNMVDLIIIDPPYNIKKKFNQISFNKKTNNDYYDYVKNIIKLCYPILSNNGSLYFCADWNSSAIVHNALQEHFIIQNRITWKRDKGRSSKRNWKNNSEDIFFVTKTNNYFFNPVKIKKKVIAPYYDKDGNKKDWFIERGEKYRATACGNFLDNITIPFWSMKENTIHPTQKPEKLIAKLILASSKQGDLVLDLFSGSGTTSAVCKKLGRQFIAIEIDPLYCKIIQERLESLDNTIQGYDNTLFLERNHNV